MSIKHFIFLGLISFVTSCDNTSVYCKLDKDFKKNRWTSDNSKTHTFEITDDSKSYNLHLKFSHVYDYQFESVPLTIKITNPERKSEQIPFDLKIKDASGKHLADCAGDICDATVPLRENIKLMKGNYTITIANTFKGPYLPNVLAVGLEVKAAE